MAVDKLHNAHRLFERELFIFELMNRQLEQLIEDLRTTSKYYPPADSLRFAHKKIEFFAIVSGALVQTLVSRKNSYPHIQPQQNRAPDTQDEGLVTETSP